MMRIQSSSLMAAVIAALVFAPYPGMAAPAAPRPGDAGAPVKAATPATAVVAAAPSATLSAPVAAPEPAAPAAEPAKEPTKEPVKEAAEKPELVGASVCLSCHTDRESFHGNIHAKAWPKEKGIDFEHSCETCHGPGSLHAAAAGDRSNAGFATIKSPAKLPAKEAAAICMQCHEGKGRTHWEGSVHETRGVSCLDCHSLHAGHPKNLRQEKIMDVCLRCHQNMKAELARQSHHPIREGKITCTNCHNPHGTAGPKLLAMNGVNETCYQCHAEKRGPFLYEHRPVVESCTNCHVPHGSVHNKLLRQKAPFLCQECHSGSRHPGTIYAVNPATPGATTFNKLKIQGMYRACLNCHANIHGSNDPNGQRFLR